MAKFMRETDGEGGEGGGVAAQVGNKITTKRPTLPRWVPKNEKCMNSKYYPFGFVGLTLV